VGGAKNQFLSMFGLRKKLFPNGLEPSCLVIR